MAITISTSGSGGGTAVEIFPRHGTDYGQNKIQKRQRTIDGSEFVYRENGGFTRVVLDLEFVNQTDRAQLYTWWLLNTTVHYFETENPTFSATGRIMGDKFPLSKRTRPYNDLWEGKLILESF